MVSAERDAVLRGAARALEGDPAAGGPGLLEALAHDLVAVDPRWATLLVPGLAGGEPEPFELAAAARMRALPPRRWQALAAAARAFRDGEPGHRGALAREVATLLLEAGSPPERSTAWRAGTPAGPAARGGGSVVRTGCLALSTLGAFAVLGFGLLAAGLARSSGGRPIVRPPRQGSVRRPPPNGRRTVGQLDASPRPAPPVPRDRTEREAAAVGALRAIAAAEVLARDVDGARDESFRYASLAGLVASRRLAPGFQGGARQGYVFAAGPASEAPGERFWATASPERAEPGARWFYADQSGAVLAATAPFTVDEETGAPASPAPPPAPAPARGDPERARAFALVGTDALYAGRWLDAVEPLETALELAPGDLEARVNLGKAYLELGGLDRWTREGQLPANVFLARAEDALAPGAGPGAGRGGAGPIAALGRNNLGLVFLKRGEDAGRLPAGTEARLAGRLAHLRRAAACFEEALALDGTFEVARVNAAAAWLGEADLVPPEERARSGERALAALEGSRALRDEDPLAPAAYRNLGLAHRATGHHREAVQALLHVLQAGAGAADERTSAALAEEALALAAPGEKPASDDDRELARLLDDQELARKAAQLLHARGRAGVRGSAADEDAAAAIERALESR